MLWKARDVAGRSRGEFRELQTGNTETTNRERKTKKKLYCENLGEWAEGVYSFKSEEFRIIETLSEDYPVKLLCELMGVSRAGYYKWKNKEKTPRDFKRKRIIELVKEVHKSYPTHGYRWVCAYINGNYEEECSESLVYKIFRYLGYKAETRHRSKERKRTKTDRYPNLIFTTWDTVDSPRQVIVSDMTSMWIDKTYYEMTLYFDVFTKEILSWNLSDCRGDRNPYIEGLKEVVKVLDGWDSEEPTIIHTDQGSVYSSKAYNDIIRDKNIKRSMSRAGKPTDNPVNESLNGWIKEELEVEFKFNREKDKEEVIKNYVKFYNEKRPSFSLNYDTPKNYYNKYLNGETLRKQTFKNRILTTEPKFVQERKRKSREMKAIG